MADFSQIQNTKLRKLLENSPSIAELSDHQAVNLVKKITHGGQEAVEKASAVLQRELEEFTTTPEQLQSYIEQAEEALEQMKQISKRLDRRFSKHSERVERGKENKVLHALLHELDQL